MKLKRSDNALVRSEIVRGLRTGKVPTKRLISQVYKNVRLSVPDCNFHHISGLISGMTKEGIIHYSSGICWR